MDVAIYCSNAFSWVNICDRDWKLTRLNSRNVLAWINERGEGAYLIFGTDVVPAELYDEKLKKPADSFFSFLMRGGVVIWIGDSPFLHVEGERGKIIDTGHSYPFEPAHTTLKETTNSIVGDALEYKPTESLRPVGGVIQDFIPISYKDGFYSSWIYKIGKGYFVRLYDTKSVDANYVISFPEKFSKLFNTYAFRIRYRKFKKEELRLILPKKKMVVILGYNNEGKTSILEAISLIDESNVEVIKNYRKKDIDGEIEGFIEGEYFNVKYFQGSRQGSVKISAAMIYPYQILSLAEKVKITPELSKELSEILSAFDESIFYVYYSSENEIRVLYKDRSDYSISELGQGFRNLISFLLYYLVKKPDILLIDDLENFSFHPTLLYKFLDYLLEKSRSKLIMITTQSPDIKNYVKEKGKLSDIEFILLNGNRYEILSSEEAVKSERDLRYEALDVKLRALAKELRQILTEEDLKAIEESYEERHR